MTYRDYFEICDKAIKEKSFVPVFRGEKGFEIESIHADVPTDWDIAIRVTIYNYYRCRGENKEIPILCYNSILALLQGSAIDVWCAYNAFYYFAMNEKRGNAPFNIINTNLKERIKRALLECKDELKRTKVYTGKGLKGGLWGDVIILTNLLKGHGIQGFEGVLKNERN